MNKTEEGDSQMSDQYEEGSIVSQTTLEETPLYDVVKQEVQIGSAPGDTAPTVSIMSKAGDYAGEEGVRKLLDKHGISPEMRDDDACVCTIGWSEREQKWYGWSHRAYFGYRIGDDGFSERGKIETLEQAKDSASAYAEDVS